MDSDMDLILDMMPSDNIVYNVMEEGKSNEYYQGQAEHILQTIDNTEHYFHFVYTILKDYHKLTDSQRTTIRDRMGIIPEIVERVVIKEKIVYKEKKKPKINEYDDY
jgi:hypothetical protein